MLGDLATIQIPQREYCNEKTRDKWSNLGTLYYLLLLCFRIENFVVFCITAATSILAYIWLVIVLKVSSPGQIEVWEAVLTFLFFPILVCLAYAGDKGYLDALFCQRDANKLTNKQQQLELGNAQSGESKYIVPGL